MDFILEYVLIKQVVAPILIIIGSFLLERIARLIVKRIFSLKIKQVDERKQKTLLSLTNNIIKYFILIVAFLMILDVFGVDTKSIVASLGVLGLVVGLAVQDILKDFISGMFIIFDNQYRVGDTIRLGTFEGEVISLGLKTTKVKAYTGEVKIVANRSITEVVNRSLINSLALVDITVSYKEDLKKVEQILTELCRRLTEELEDLTGPVQLLGVQNLSDDGVVFRITAETIPMLHFKTEREMRKQIKLELDQHNITIPYNQLVVYNGNDV